MAVLQPRGFHLWHDLPTGRTIGLFHLVDRGVADEKVLTVRRGTRTRRD